MNRSRPPPSAPPGGKPRAARASTHRGVLVLALLLLALPLLLGALALGTGGLPHEGLSAASARDVSAAALDKIERFLHGDLTVALAAPTTDAERAVLVRAACHAPTESAEVATFPPPATVQRRL